MWESSSKGGCEGKRWELVNSIKREDRSGKGRNHVVRCVYCYFKAEDNVSWSAIEVHLSVSIT